MDTKIRSGDIWVISKETISVQYLQTRAGKTSEIDRFYEYKQFTFVSGKSFYSFGAS